MHSGLRFTDLGRLRLVSDPQLSSAGRLAYVESWLDLATDTTRRNVVLAHPAGLPLRLPLGGANAYCPRWSPDGSRLAVISGSGPGAAQVAVWQPDHPILRPLGPVPGSVTELDWAPDGSRLAVCAVRHEAPDATAAVRHPAGPGRVDGAAGLVREDRRIFELPADGSAARELAAGAWHPRWAPDGTRLAFLSAAGPTGPVQLRILAPGDPAAACVAAEGAVAFCWEPAGTRLAYLAPRPGEFADADCRLFRCEPADDAVPVELAAGWDRSLGSTVRGDDPRGAAPQAPLWSAATGRIYFCVADGGRGLIGWAGPDPADHGVLCDGLRSCLEPFLSGDGQAIAFVSTTPTHPGEVHLTDLRTGSEQTLTAANEWLTPAELAPASQVRAEAADGTPIEGWLTSPGPGRPLVVSIHGGPHYPAGWRFSFEAQRLAARGYAVLTANPRGSGGYGREFATAIRGRWGGPDLADLSCLIDAVGRGGEADGDRIAVTGVSYGGYLALLAITRSRRFRAAISENGISDLLALWGTGAEDPGWLTAEMGGPPWAAAAHYLAASPLADADKIDTPLLLIHAELDQNCPVSQSEQMLAALRYRGATAELIRLDGEGHLVNLTGRPSRREARAEAVDAWLDQYLAADSEGKGNDG